MAYSAADARQQILDSLAQAAEELGAALAALGEAYEQMDDQSAERLEDGLFRPLQGAYGRAKRTHSEFADRIGAPRQTFAAPVPGAPSHGVRGFLDSALEHVARADTTIALLQDSMLPVEVGDPQLRTGLGDVRMALSSVPARARELTRTLGR